MENCKVCGNQVDPETERLVKSDIYIPPDYHIECFVGQYNSAREKASKIIEREESNH